MLRTIGYPPRGKVVHEGDHTPFGMTPDALSAEWTDIHSQDHGPAVIIRLYLGCAPRRIRARSAKAPVNASVGHRRPLTP